MTIFRTLVFETGSRTETRSSPIRLGFLSIPTRLYPNSKEKEGVARSEPRRKGWRAGKIVGESGM